MIPPSPSIGSLPKRALIAHRGVPARCPENGAGGLTLARDTGAPAIEIDVRPTSDGLLVVLHDASPRRLTGQRRPAAALSARELLEPRRLDAPADPTERLLLLDEALALVAGRCLLDIEIKPDEGAPPGELALRVAAALARAGHPDGVVLTSESEEILAALGRQLPDVPRGLVFRTLDRRDAVTAALGTLSSVLVSSVRRAGERLIRRAHTAGLVVWAYTVNDPSDAQRLFDLGCDALFTDDWPRMQRETGGTSLSEGTAEGCRVATPSPPVLVLDLGSTSSKAAWVDPARGIVHTASAPTPTERPGPGLVEHDAEAVVECARELIDALRRRTEGVRPAAFGLAAQRSTGLWARRSTLAPLTRAASWRDRRGTEIVERLSARAEELESIARLPLDPAWTAVKGCALLDPLAAGDDALLLPLGSWVGSILTGAAPRVDPTLANRMFLLDARRGAWSPVLIDAFRLSRGALPYLVPTVDDQGELPWPGGGRIPWTALVGDQQAAYIGSAGPLGERLVLNLGTAGFAMRAGKLEDTLPTGGRCAPLWTSRTRREPVSWLVEIPVVPPGNAHLAARTVDDAVREVARRVALGDPAPREFARRVADALHRLSGPARQTVAVCGGGTQSPQLLALIAEAYGATLAVARAPEATLLGSARLAAAGAGLRWAVPAGGGFRRC